MGFGHACFIRHKLDCYAGCGQQLFVAGVNLFMDEIKKLLAFDLAKNYSSETLTADEYFDAIQVFEKSGNKVKRIGTSLFLIIENK
jgi:hypothetical protein